MKITALVENTTKTDWPVEHGLSLFIETGNHCILFDTGQSTLFAENAKRLGINLEEADICILSHGHYDHGGGLKEFVRINQKASIYMNQNAFGLHYHGKDRYIGLPRQWLEDLELQNRIIYTNGDAAIDNELMICVPLREKRILMGSAGLCVKENGNYFPEEFLHEHYLMIHENEKHVLISGCSHQGIINIMDWYQPDVLVGGFHFMKQECNDILIEYGKMLSEYDAEYYTCHCTGVEQYEFLKHYMNRIHYLSEGEMIKI